MGRRFWNPYGVPIVPLLAFWNPYGVPFVPFSEGSDQQVLDSQFHAIYSKLAKNNSLFHGHTLHGHFP